MAIAHRGGEGDDTRALFVIRRWLVTVVALNLALVVSLAGRYRWSELSTVERVLLVSSIALIIVGVVRGRRTWALWFLVAGMACLPLAALVAPLGTPVWLPMPNVASNVFYVAILLVSIRAGLVLVFAAPALVAIVWAREPTNIVTGALELAGGLIVVAQILCSCLVLWWAFRLLLNESVAADEVVTARRERTARSIEVQTRERMWRAAATRLHESVLNTIRYALSAGPLDRARLKGELQTPMPEVLAIADQDFTVRDLAASIAREGVLVSTGRRGAVLTAHVFEACRAAVAELITNALTHGQATRVTVNMSVTPNGRLVLTVTDNGRGLVPGWVPGIGTRTVLDLSLGDIDGTWHLEQVPDAGVMATIVVPVESSTESSTADGATGLFDRGRLLASAVFAGACMVGPIYSIWLVDGHGGIGVAAAVATSIGCVVAAAATYRRRRLGLVGLLILLPIVVPWLLQTNAYDCPAVPEVAGILNISGFAVAVVALWWRPLWGFLGLGVWAIGGLQLVLQFPGSCRQAVSIALLNSMMIFPLLVLVTFIGIRAFQRARAKDDDVRHREVVERSQTVAVVDLNASLDRSVREAVALLDEIADGRPVDDSMRKALERADARIRVAIQVDPQTSGCFVLAARRLVMYAASVDVPMHVRALGSSKHRRPLPIELEVLLRRLVAEPVSDPAGIQAFTDGHYDHLSITTAGSAVAHVGLHAGESRRIDDIVIEVGVPSGNEASPVMVLVSRALEVSHEGATS